MNRFEALDAVYKINELLEEKRLGEAMQVAGMTEELFPEGATLSELIEIFQVRLTDLMKIAGIK